MFLPFSNPWLNEKYDFGEILVLFLSLVIHDKLQRVGVLKPLARGRLERFAADQESAVILVAAIQRTR